MRAAAWVIGFPQIAETLPDQCSQDAVRKRETKTGERAMDVSLARDPAGNAFPLPDQAAFWRVRRHTGGRPSAVVGPNGEPLFIAINGDLDSLVDAGCAPGSYRLEAVDVQRRAVGSPIAFVEIVEPQQQPIAHGDLLRASIEALTRTTEAMQRTQLERERASAARERELMNAQVEAQRALIESQKAQMQLVASLFERVPAPGDPVAILKQQMSLQRVIDRQRYSDAIPDQPIHSATDSMPWWLQLLTQYGPYLGMLATGKPPHEVLAILATQTGMAVPPVEAASAVPTEPSPDAVPPPPAPSVPSVKEKIQTILDRLTPDERMTVKRHLDGLPDDGFERAMRYVGQISIDEAVAWVRSHFINPASPANGHSKP